MASRMFEGRNYYLVKSFNHKKDATKYAADWRKRRWLARVTEEGYSNRIYYSVWIRKNKKNN